MATGWLVGTGRGYMRSGRSQETILTSDGMKNSIVLTVWSSNSGDDDSIGSEVKAAKRSPFYYISKELEARKAQIASNGKSIHWRSVSEIKETFATINSMNN